jgi:hypothetical protein
LIIGAAFSAVMIVGAFVSVEVGRRQHRGVDEPQPSEPVHTHSSTAGTIMQEQLVG